MSYFESMLFLSLISTEQNLINVYSPTIINIIGRQPPGDNTQPKSSHLAMCTAACIGEKCLNVEKLVADKNEAIRNGHLLLSRLQSVSLIVISANVLPVSLPIEVTLSLYSCNIRFDRNDNRHV